MRSPSLYAMYMLWFDMKVRKTFFAVACLVLLVAIFSRFRLVYCNIVFGCLRLDFLVFEAACIGSLHEF